MSELNSGYELESLPALNQLISSKSLFMFDVEGVLCNNIDNPLPAEKAAKLIADLKKAGKKVVVITNVARKSQRYVYEKLREIDLPLESREIVTAGATAAHFVRRNWPKGRCFVISEGGLLEDVLAAGVEAVLEKPVDVVAIGANRRMSYVELNFATRLVLEGSALICAGASATFRGSFMGDEGVYIGEAAIAEAISFATGKPVTYFGKPYPEIFLEALAVQGCKPDEAVMFGDTLASDIRGAKRVGIESVFLSKSDSFDDSTLPPEQRPDHVIKDLSTFHEAAF